MFRTNSFVRRAIARVAVLALIPTALVAQATGSLAGRVTTGAENVPGATVVVVGTGRGAQTRPDGTYRLTLPAGRYEVRVRLLGYASTRDSVTITAGETTTRNYSLEKAAASLEAVTTLGTRGEARSVIDAPVPIDVLSAADIKATGRTETAQQIQAIAPSFNFPRATIGDGTDHVRPSTLRGLGPDQALVLINGKRRYTSALVNVNGTVGRGSTGVDLNAIPSSLIDHIEILRDGAAAQYGSDAIAGVINIVLKKDASGDYVTTIGQNFTTYNRTDDAVKYLYPSGERSARDGRVFQAAINKGFVVGDRGFVHGTVEVRDRGYTNRSLPDLRLNYFRSQPNPGDPIRFAKDSLTHRQGDAYTHDVSALFNAGNEFSNGTELYLFGGGSRRVGEAAGFFRRARDDRTLRALNPDGFLPLIHSTINDYSGTIGLKGNLSAWKWDLSTAYGGNKFGFLIKSSENAVLPTTTPQREFDAGALQFGQSTTNLDLFRTLPVFDQLRVAAGAEFRADNYQIQRGEPNSYFTDTTARVLDSLGGRTTRRPAPFSQVFPGFSPVQETNRTRNNVAGYLDFEADVSKSLLLGIAGRVERYSDFGGTATGKVSGRFEPVKNYALRGAISSGFRAPSLGQSFFQSTATNFVGGVPLEIRTLAVDDPLARRLGARDLKPEKSVNYSAGIAMEPVPSISITADYYRIDIKDRVVFSENLIGAAVVNFFTANGRPEVTGARFFTNALDTRTDGLDVITNFGHSFSNGGVMRLTGGLNVNHTSLTRVDSIAQFTPGTLPDGTRLLQYGRVERIRVERGQPRDNIILSANYNQRGFGGLLRSQRFGKVTTAGSAATDTLDQTFRAKWITDANLSYSFKRIYTLSIGADNLLDVYPDRNNTPGNPLNGPNGSPGDGTSGNGNVGIFPYNGISPFGFNGRYLYTKLSVSM
ncbi:MAG: TonB-dependent receptor [Gemmatimonadaceae bacterium]|nr:TonB-dependent receptor [Gemmatimonadaceae bacterium]